MATPGTAQWQPYKPGVGSLRPDAIIPTSAPTAHVGPNGMTMDEWSKSQGYLSAPPGQPWPSGQGALQEAAAGPPAFPQYTGPSGNQEYQRIFTEALGKSRAGIEDQYSLALGEIARQQGVANQGLDKYAPQINDIYGQAGTAMDQWGAASLQAQAASPLQPYGPAGFGMMPIRAAMEAGKAGALSDEGYLRTGMQDLYDRQRSGANLAKQGMLSEVSNRELDYRLKQADDDYQQRNEWNLRKWDADRDDYWKRQGLTREDQMYARERGDKLSDIASEREYEQSLLKQKSGLNATSFGSKETSLGRGEALATSPEAGSLRSSKSYREVSAYIKKHRNNPQLARMVANHWPNATKAASLAMFDNNNYIPQPAQGA